MNRNVTLVASIVCTLTACPPTEDGPTHPTAPPVGSTKGPVAPPPEATHVELATDVEPRHYDLALSIDPRQPEFSGEVKIAVFVSKPASHIVLHARDLSIAKADVVLPSGRTLTAVTSLRSAFGARDAKEELVLSFAEPVPVGQATLRMTYSAPFAQLRGIYRVESDGKWYAFSQMEPTDARRAFPSFDEPRHKTPLAVRVRVPSAMVAFTNGAEVRREPDGDSTVFHFAETKPIPTYLFAVAVGELETLDGPKTPTPIRFVAPAGRAASGPTTLDATDKTLKVLEGYFERPYPYGKLDIAAVPNFGPGAMENVGLVTFRDELVVLDASSPAGLRRRMQLIMAHELAHQWFGNLVTMRWWDDLWLNEGFATWMAPKTCDDAFPGFASRVERVLDKSYAMNADVLPSARAVRTRITTSDQIREAGGWTAYTKGAAILTMLESWLGEESFQKAIRAYVNENENRSITSEALFAALDASTGKPVSKVASSFLEQPSLPLVKVSVDCKAGVSLEVSDAASGDRKWSTPICLSIDDKPVCTVVEGKAIVPIPAGSSCATIFPNYREAGYFRYEVDAASDKAIREKLATLHETERAGYVLNAWALVTLGKRDVGSLIALLKAAANPKETSRIVLAAVINVLTDLERTTVSEANEPAFKTLVTQLLRPHQKRLGMPAKGAAEADVDRVHRAFVLGALFDLADDAEVAKALEPLAKTYLDDPTKADPDLGPLALRVSVRAGGVAAKTLDGARLARAKNPVERVALTVAIASRRDPAALTEALSLFLTGGIRSGDWRHVRTSALRRRDTRKTFYAFLRDHFDELKTRAGHVGALTSTLGATCDKAELEGLVTFFEPKLSSLEGAQRGYDEGLAEAKRCLELRARLASK